MVDQGVMIIPRLGELLGLAPDFIAQVQAGGQKAIINRVAYTDQTGARSRFLALVQRVGMYMEERMLAGDPADSDDLLDSIASFGQDLDIPPALAVELVGPVVEIFQGAAKVAAKGPTNGLLRDGQMAGAGNGAASRPDAGVRQRASANG